MTILVGRRAPATTELDPTLMNETMRSAQRPGRRQLSASNSRSGAHIAPTTSDEIVKAGGFLAGERRTGRTNMEIAAHELTPGMWICSLGTEFQVERHSLSSAVTIFFAGCRVTVDWNRRVEIVHALAESTA
jgi:hypothetical protein